MKTKSILNKKLSKKQKKEIKKLVHKVIKEYGWVLRKLGKT